MVISKRRIRFCLVIESANNENMFREIHCNVSFNTNRRLLFILPTRSSLSLSLTHTIATDTHIDRSQRASFSPRCSAAKNTAAAPARPGRGPPAASAAVPPLSPAAPDRSRLTYFSAESPARLAFAFWS